MTPDERARSAANINAKLANIDAILADIRARQERYKAEEPERLRQQIKTHLAVERMHQANKALRAALR
jgi:hypothetical protein